MNIPESIRGEPHKWKQTQYTFKHEDGLQVWTANGFLFINTCPKGFMPFSMKVKIWLAMRWWSENQPATRSTNKPT